MKIFKQLICGFIMIITVATFVSCKKSPNDPTGTVQKMSSINKETTLSKATSTALKTTSKASTSAEVTEPEADIPENPVSDEPFQNDNQENETVLGTDVFLSDDMIDLQGRDITIWSAWAPTDVLGEGSSPLWDAIYSSIKDAEKLYNCRITFRKPTISGNTWPPFIAAVMAGESLVDCMENGSPLWYEQGIVARLDTVIDFTHPIFKEVPIDGLGKWKGVYYGFPSYAHAATQLNWAILYHRGIIEQFGLQELREMDNEGRWTWETFRNVMLTLTVDLNGDGIIDQYGIDSQAAALGNALAELNSGSFIYVDQSDNKFKLNMRNFGFMNAMNFARQMVYVDKIVDTKNATGGTGFKKGLNASWLTGGYQMKYIKDWGISTDNVGLVVVPNGPDAVGNPQIQVAGGRVFVFPSTLKDKEKVIQVVCDALMFWDKNKTFFQMGNSYTPWDGTKRMGDTMTENDLNYWNRKSLEQNFYYSQWSQIPNLAYWAMVDKILNGSESISSTIDTYYPQFQTALDNIN